MSAPPIDHARVTSPPSFSAGRFPRAIFFDLDGTLLAQGAVLTRHTNDAVRAAAVTGAAIILATGGFSARTHHLARALAETGQSAESAGRPRPGGVWTVTHNGAAIWDPDGRLVHHDAMPVEALECALAQAGPRLWVTYETVDHEPVDGQNQTQVRYAGRLRPDLVHFLWGPQAPQVTAEGDLAAGLEPRWDWRRARSPGAYRRGAVLGCWCIGSPAALTPLDAQATGGTLHRARYLPWGARLGQLLGKPRLRLLGRDLGAMSASKGAAAAWLCDRLGIATQATAAFGDGDNDLELLAFAGVGVAMANATPRALAAADMVAPPNTENGVAQVLQAWLTS